jgi:cytochrome b
MMPVLMSPARFLRRHAFTLLRIWHAVFAGGYLVAYLTADEDTYAMHQFAGYLVLTALAVRLAFGLLAPAGHPLRLPRPSLSDIRAWLARRRGRNPLFAWFAVALLAVVGLAAISGAVADYLPPVEDLHEAVAESSLWLIVAHIAFVTVIYSGRRLKTWLADMFSRLSGSGTRP